MFVFEILMFVGDLGAWILRCAVDLLHALAPQRQTEGEHLLTCILLHTYAGVYGT